LQVLLPGYSATLVCTPTVTTGPVTCTITIQWVERVMGMDKNQTSLATLGTTSYALLVQP